MRVAVLHRSPSLAVVDYRCDARPGDVESDEWHDVFSLSYVRRGSFGYRSGGRAYELVAGATLVGRAGDEFRCTHDHHAGGDECLSFQFQEGADDALGCSLSAFRTGVVPAMPGVMVLGELAESTARGQTNLGLDEVAVMFTACLHEVAAGRTHESTHVPARDRRRVVDAALWLDERSRDVLRLEDVAARTGLSACHFLRTFRAVTGVTPHQYLVRCRLRQAARLLAADAPITSIAYDVGFADLSNFVRTFRRAAGVSPRQFRRLSRGDRNFLQERIAHRL